MSLYRDRITVGRKIAIVIRERMLTEKDACRDAHITEETLTKLLTGSYEKKSLIAPCC